MPSALRLPWIGVSLAALGLLATSCADGGSPIDEAPRTLHLSAGFEPQLSALERELEPTPGHRVWLRRAAGDAQVEVRETWQAAALGATPLPGVWSARPSMTLSLSARRLPREVLVDGVPFEVQDADVAARAIKNGEALTPERYAELEGELLILCASERAPKQVELRTRLPLGDFTSGRWRLAFPTFGGAGWLLVPDAAGACGAFEAPAPVRAPGRLVLRALNLDRRAGGTDPALLTLRTGGGASQAFELPAFDAAAPWLELEWSPDAPWTRLEFELRGSLAAAVLDARWIPAESAVAQERPDVLVFLADTFRADLMRAYRGAPAGEGVEATPELDAWAAQHTLFKRSWSASSWTLPTQASLLSGLPPTEHGAVAPNRALDETAPLLATHFAAAGYRCTAITDGLFLAPKYGFDGGFEWFDARAHRGEVDARVGAAWGDGDPRPRFSYVQSYRTHSPYTASPSARAEFDGRLSPARDDASGRAELEALGASLEAGGAPLDRDNPELVASMKRLRHLYVAGARDLDRMFTRVRERFEASARDPEQVVVVFTSDHGEAFGEHGRMDHGAPVYEHQVRVPLVIAAPGWPAALREDAAQTLDLAPTLARLVGLERDPRWSGRDLRSTPEDTRAVWTWQANGGLDAQARGRLWGDLKVLRTAADEEPLVFDLRRDPLELTPWSGRDERVLRALEAFESEEPDKLRLRPGAGRGLELTGEDRQALEAMGYVAGSEDR